MPNSRTRCSWWYFGVLAVAVLVGCAAPVETPMPDDYADSIETWRHDRVAKLTSETGWVTLVGLFWFEDGEHRIGSAVDSEMQLPEKAPPAVGVLRANGDELVLDVDAGTEVLVDGKRVETLALADDDPGPATQLEVGDFSVHVIRRDEQRALRVRDRNHPARFSLGEIESFPTDWNWRIEGRFEVSGAGRTIQVPTVLGTVSEQPSSGTVVFEVGGEEIRIDVVAEPGADQLFLIFGDETTGRETYGGGRYLYAAAPDEEGVVVLDFNKAYNPPCVFTPFATCPLPPSQNRLPVRIEAGEKSYGAKSSAEPTD